ncbi:hypothetical protein AAG570_004320 [Ranatra chinensis]|uniref:RPA43 OB domain-containing protein n=1 Tax=Ranatra chinensis TaxID=642074 RepID=A0ABD0Y0H7_9HEMI
MAKQKVNFDLNQLNELVAAEDSCVTLKSRYRILLNVTPMHLTNIKESVKELLEARSTTYDPELDGIILSYRNVKIMDSVQLVDNGNFSLECFADVYVFRPSLGSVLKGIVNKKGRDHLGCLVHSVFNVSLPREDYSEKKSWPGNRIGIGQEVAFTVIKLDFAGRLPYIRGHLIESESHDDYSEEVDSGIGHLESVGEEDANDSSLELKTKRNKKHDPADAVDLGINDNDKHLLPSSEGLVSSEHTSEGVPSPKNKSKKRKFSDLEMYTESARKKGKFICEVEDNRNVLSPNALDNEYGLNSGKVKRTKKSRDHSISSDSDNVTEKVEVCKVNNDEDLISKLMQDRLSEAEQLESLHLKKKHRREKKKSELVHIETGTSGMISPTGLEADTLSGKVKKKKKKKGHEHTIDSEVDHSTMNHPIERLLGSSSSAYVHSLLEDSHREKKKKKDHEIEMVTSVDHPFDTDNLLANHREFSSSTQVGTLGEEIHKKKKNKKKSHEGALSESHPQTFSPVESQPLQEETHKKKKKKKNDHEIDPKTAGTQYPSSNPLPVNHPEPFSNTEFHQPLQEETHKKKKKKKKDHEIDPITAGTQYPFSNPLPVNHPEPFSNTEAHQPLQEETQKKKKKKKKDHEIDPITAGTQYPSSNPLPVNHQEPFSNTEVEEETHKKKKKKKRDHEKDPETTGADYKYSSNLSLDNHPEFSTTVVHKKEHGAEIISHEKKKKSKKTKKNTESEKSFNDIQLALIAEAVSKLT